MPVSSSSTSRTPSGGLFTRSRISLATRANVRGGKFSLLELPAQATALDPGPLIERDDDRREGLADDDPDRLPVREEEVPMEEPRERAEAPVLLEKREPVVEPRATDDWPIEAEEKDEEFDMMY